MPTCEEEQHRASHWNMVASSRQQSAVGSRQSERHPATLSGLTDSGHCQGDVNSRSPGLACLPSVCTSALPCHVISESQCHTTLACLPFACTCAPNPPLFRCRHSMPRHECSNGSVQKAPASFSTVKCQEKDSCSWRPSHIPDTPVQKDETAYRIIAPGWWHLLCPAAQCQAVATSGPSTTDAGSSGTFRWHCSYCGLSVTLLLSVPPFQPECGGVNRAGFASASQCLPASPTPGQSRSNTGTNRAALDLLRVRLSDRGRAKQCRGLLASAAALQGVAAVAVAPARAAAAALPPPPMPPTSTDATASWCS